MRTRTKLTSPPGHEPVDDRVLRGDETYVPAFDLPHEPHVPSRHRGLLVWSSVLVILVIVGWLAFRVMTTGQSEDPSLQQPAEQPTGQPAGQPTDPAS